jgi:hypothetical protein
MEQAHEINGIVLNVERLIRQYADRFALVVALLAIAALAVIR